MMGSPRKILVTGAKGQLGAHTVVRLRYKYGSTVLAADRKSFSDADWLADNVAQADAIIHLGGVNRGSDADVSAGNTALAEALISACRRAGRTPPLSFASTIHVNRDDAYGRSKKQAGKLLADFWHSQGSRCAVVHLPNLFGEFSRPDYNNFTGTFCHQIVGGSAPTVNSDAPVQLMHYGDAADALFRALDGSGHEDLHPSGRPTSVATVATKLVNMHETYAKGTIPALADIFDTQLFNMLRQVMFQRQFPAELKRHADARGSFFECIRSENQGQTSFSTTRPGITRGNHFHFNLVERFVVLSGSARISVRRLTDNHVWHFDVTGDAPCFIDMPTLHTHNITNTGRDDLYTLFWVNRFFNPDDTDTYVEPV